MRNERGVTPWHDAGSLGHEGNTGSPGGEVAFPVRESDAMVGCDPDHGILKKAEVFKVLFDSGAAPVKNLKAFQIIGEILPDFRSVRGVGRQIAFPGFARFQEWTVGEEEACPKEKWFLGFEALQCFTDIGRHFFIALSQATQLTILLTSRPSPFDGVLVGVGLAFNEFVLLSAKEGLIPMPTKKGRQVITRIAHRATAVGQTQTAFLMSGSAGKKGYPARGAGRCCAVGAVKNAGFGGELFKKRRGEIREMNPIDSAHIMSVNDEDIPGAHAIGGLIFVPVTLLLPYHVEKDRASVEIEFVDQLADEVTAVGILQFGRGVTE